MITEEYIKSIPGVVIEDDTYLFDKSSAVIPCDVEVRVDGDLCPYCGAPFIGYQHNGPGGWSYRIYTCGAKAAINFGVAADSLFAITKPSALCIVHASLVTTKEDEDNVI